MRNGSALCRWSGSVNSSRLSILPIKVLFRSGGRARGTEVRRRRYRLFYRQLIFQIVFIIWRTGRRVFDCGFKCRRSRARAVAVKARDPDQFFQSAHLWRCARGNGFELRAKWIEELEAMRARLNQMRNALADKLTELGAADRFEFIRRQRGMFSYSGLTAPQVERLRNEFGIYALSTGRICLAALNTENIDTVARAIMRILSTN